MVDRIAVSPKDWEPVWQRLNDSARRGVRHHQGDSGIDRIFKRTCKAFHLTSKRTRETARFCHTTRQTIVPPDVNVRNTTPMRWGCASPVDATLAVVSASSTQAQDNSPVSALKKKLQEAQAGDMEKVTQRLFMKFAAECGFPLLSMESLRDSLAGLPSPGLTQVLNLSRHGAAQAGRAPHAFAAIATRFAKMENAAPLYRLLNKVFINTDAAPGITNVQGEMVRTYLLLRERFGICETISKPENVSNEKNLCPERLGQLAFHALEKLVKSGKHVWDCHRDSAELNAMERGAINLARNGCYGNESTAWLKIVTRKFGKMHDYNKRARQADGGSSFVRNSPLSRVSEVHRIGCEGTYSRALRESRVVEAAFRLHEELYPLKDMLAQSGRAESSVSSSNEPLLPSLPQQSLQVLLFERILLGDWNERNQKLPGSSELTTLSEALIEEKASKALAMFESHGGPHPEREAMLDTGRAWFRQATLSKEMLLSKESTPSAPHHLKLDGIASSGGVLKRMADEYNRRVDALEHLEKRSAHSAVAKAMARRARNFTSEAVSLPSFAHAVSADSNDLDYSRLEKADQKLLRLRARMSDIQERMQSAYGSAPPPDARPRYETPIDHMAAIAEAGMPVGDTYQFSSAHGVNLNVSTKQITRLAALAGSGGLADLAVDIKAGLEGSRESFVRMGVSVTRAELQIGQTRRGKGRVGAGLGASAAGLAGASGSVESAMEWRHAQSLVMSLPRDGSVELDGKPVKAGVAGDAAVSKMIGKLLCDIQRSDGTPASLVKLLGDPRYAQLSVSIQNANSRNAGAGLKGTLSAFAEVKSGLTVNKTSSTTSEQSGSLNVESRQHVSSIVGKTSMGIGVPMLDVFGLGTIQSVSPSEVQNRTSALCSIVKSRQVYSAGSMILSMSDMRKYTELLASDHDRIIADLGKKRRQDAVGEKGTETEAAAVWSPPVQGFSSRAASIQDAMNGHAEGVVFMLLEQDAAELRNLVQALRETGELDKIIRKNPALKLEDAIRNFENDVTMTSQDREELSHAYAVSSMRAKAYLEGSSKTSFVLTGESGVKMESYVAGL